MASSPAVYWVNSKNKAAPVNRGRFSVGLAFIPPEGLSPAGIVSKVVGSIAASDGYHAGLRSFMLVHGK